MAVSSITLDITNYQVKKGDKVVSFSSSIGGIDISELKTKVDDLAEAVEACDCDTLSQSITTINSNISSINSSLANKVQIYEVSSKSEITDSSPDGIYLVIPETYRRALARQSSGATKWLKE